MSESHDFPTTPGAYQTEFFFARDTFVAKFNPAGSGADSLVYSIFLGINRSNLGFGRGIAVDESGHALVAGTTVVGSSTFSRDAFVAKINPEGSDLAQRTLVFGGDDLDAAYDIALDASGNIYVAGSTASTEAWPFRSRLRFRLSASVSGRTSAGTR